MLSQSHRSRRQELYALCANAFSNVSRICLFLPCLHLYMNSPFSQPLTLSSHSGAFPFGVSATRTAAIRLKYCVMVVTFGSPRKSAPAPSFARRVGRKASRAAIYPERNRMGGGTDIMRKSAWGRGGRWKGKTQCDSRAAGAWDAFEPLQRNITTTTRTVAQQALTWKLEAACWTTPPKQRQMHHHPCTARVSGHEHGKMRTRGTCSRAT